MKALFVIAVAGLMNNKFEIKITEWGDFCFLCMEAKSIFC